MTGRKPRIPIGEHRRIIAARAFVQWVKSKFGAQALARQYGVDDQTIHFIASGGQYKNFARAYENSSADTTSATHDQAVAEIQNTANAGFLLAELAKTKDGRAMMVEAVCCGLWQEPAIKGCLIDTQVLVAAYTLLEAP